MRLSDIRGDRTLDVIADIINPIANIAEDKEAEELFKVEKLPEGTNPRKYIIQRVKRHFPVLLKRHKEDVVSILSTINGVDPEQYVMDMNLSKLFKDCVELLTDEAFETFFTSAGSETDGNSSGSASENSM